MLTTGLVMLVLGVLLSLAAFIYAAYNMFNGVKNFDVTDTIGGHLGAMVVMAIGGIVSSFGLILTIVALVMLFVPAK